MLRSAFAVLCAAPVVCTAQLLGIGANGLLMDVDVNTGQATAIADTGLVAAGLEYGPDGTLYGLEFPETGTVYTVDPNTGASTFVGEFETDRQAISFAGGLAISPDGVAYTIGTDLGTDAHVMSLDLATGEAIASVPAVFNTGFLSISTVWRPDGKLLVSEAMFGPSNLWEVDPVTGDTTMISSMDFGLFGLTSIGSTSYATSSDYDLYEIDLYTGDLTLIGPLNAPEEIVGLAGIPAPGTASALGACAFLLARRRRR